jgi:hypothetical protein
LISLSFSHHSAFASSCSQRVCCFYYTIFNVCSLLRLEMSIHDLALPFFRGAARMAAFLTITNSSQVNARPPVPPTPNSMSALRHRMRVQSALRLIRHRREIGQGGILRVFAVLTGVDFPGREYQQGRERRNEEGDLPVFLRIANTEKQHENYSSPGKSIVLTMYFSKK